MVIFLINNGADINYIGGLAGTSILTDAVNNGNLKIVQLLIESGVELTAKTFAANALFAAIYIFHLSSCMKKLNILRRRNQSKSSLSDDPLNPIHIQILKRVLLPRNWKPQRFHHITGHIRIF